MATIGSLIELGSQKLAEAGIPDARREASSIVELATERDRTFLIAHPESEITEEQRELFLDLLNRRVAREPFHYLKGSREFFGLAFIVSPAVLIPRPETEILVEEAIRILRPTPHARFCEVGVGSGCISVSMLANLPEARAIGLEISAAAVAVAARNASRHGVEGRLELRVSDVFSALQNGEKFDVIVANPPYVPLREVSHLQPEVRDFEPHQALTDGRDGRFIAGRIITEAPRWLSAGGSLLIEVGMGQAEGIAEMLRSGPWAEVRLLSDLQGIPRVVGAVLSDTRNIGKD